MNNHYSIERLRTEILNEPRSADLHFELGMEYLNQQPLIQELVREETDIFEYLYSYTRYTRLWQFIDIPGIDSLSAEEALDEFKISVALGLTNHLRLAITYLLFIVLDPERKESPLYTTDEFHVIKFPGRDLLYAKKGIASCKKHLRSSSNDMKGWQILGAFYGLTAKKRGKEEVADKLEQISLLRSIAIEEHSDPETEPSIKDGRILEEKTKQLLEAMGFHTLEAHQGADSGIDITAYSSAPVTGGKLIVQCKDWAKPVGEPILRDLYGLVIAEAANKGIVIATGGFTSSAKGFAEGKQLELIDGEQLTSLLQRYAGR